MVIHRVFAISQHHSLNGIIKSIVREEYLQFLTALPRCPQIILNKRGYIKRIVSIFIIDIIFHQASRLYGISRDVSNDTLSGVILVCRIETTISAMDTCRYMYP